MEVGREGGRKEGEGRGEGEGREGKDQVKRGRKLNGALEPHSALWREGRRVRERVGRDRETL